MTLHIDMCDMTRLYDSFMCDTTHEKKLRLAPETLDVEGAPQLLIHGIDSIEPKKASTQNKMELRRALDPLDIEGAPHLLAHRIDSIFLAFSLFQYRVTRGKTK